MTLTFSTESWCPRVFLLSGLGSLGFHALFLAILASFSPQSDVPEPTPTVQVNLIPPSKDKAPTPGESPTPLLSPQPLSRPPVPSSSSRSLQPPTVPSLHASLPPRVSPTMPSRPQTPSPPVLKDNQTAKILQARTMMKMKAPEALESTALLPQRTRGALRSSPNLTPRFPSLQRPSTSTLSSKTPLLPRHQRLTAQPPAGGGGNISRPTVLASSKPLYPRIARESGWEGTVVLRVFIETSGNPGNIQIHKSSGYRLLDHAAQTAIKTWTFQPAKDGNIPVAKWVDIPIKFDLDRS